MTFEKKRGERPELSVEVRRQDLARLCIEERLSPCRRDLQEHPAAEETIRRPETTVSQRTATSLSGMDQAGGGPGFERDTADRGCTWFTGAEEGVEKGVRESGLVSLQRLRHV